MERTGVDDGAFNGSMQGVGKRWDGDVEQSAPAPRQGRLIISWLGSDDWSINRQEASMKWP